MVDSIFKEVSFTPQTFEKEFIEANNRRLGKLIAILESLIDSGIIIAASDSWQKKVFEFLSYFDDSDRDDLSTLLEVIDSRNRLAIYSGEKKLENESAWISELSRLNNKRAFSFISGTIDQDVIKPVESIEREAYLNVGAIVSTQTVENMRMILTPVLGYAEDVKIIDPYFNLSKKTYTDALHVIADTLGNHHGKTEHFEITIQTSIKSLLDKNKALDFGLAKEWSRKIQFFEKQYGHSIIVNIWEDLKEEDQWHDRWIITNQCGITMGKGSDISEWTDATWGLLDWNEIPNIANKFNHNRQTYNLIASINHLSITKKKSPKNYPVYRSADEIAEKKKNVKNFKREMSNQ